RAPCVTNRVRASCAPSRFGPGRSRRASGLRPNVQDDCRAGCTKASSAWSARVTRVEPCSPFNGIALSKDEVHDGSLLRAERIRAAEGRREAAGVDDPAVGVSGKHRGMDIALLTHRGGVPQLLRDSL